MAYGHAIISTKGFVTFALSKVRHRLRESSKDLSSFTAVQLNVVFMTILRQLNSRK